MQTIYYLPLFVSIKNGSIKSLRDLKNNKYNFIMTSTLKLTCLILKNPQ